LEKPDLSVIEATQMDRVKLVQQIEVDTATHAEALRAAREALYKAEAEAKPYMDALRVANLRLADLRNKNRDIVTAATKQTLVNILTSEEREAIHELHGDLAAEEEACRLSTKYKAAAARIAQIHAALISLTSEVQYAVDPLAAVAGIRKRLGVQPRPKPMRIPDPDEAERPPASRLVAAID
jgi:hypothetical protein